MTVMTNDFAEAEADGWVLGVESTKADVLRIEQIVLEL
jgi:hypothetical protein